MLSEAWDNTLMFNPKSQFFLDLLVLKKILQLLEHLTYHTYYIMGLHSVMITP